MIVGALVFGVGVYTFGLPLVLFGLLMVDGIARPASGLLLPVVVRGPRLVAQVALTFDDGPDPEVTPGVLDALAEAGARATFFVIGHKLQAHPDLAARIRAEGHELANHTFGHPRSLNLWSARAMQREIRRGAEAIGAPTPRAPYYRPPVGLKSPALARVAKRLGLRVVMWSLHARDTGQASGDAVAARVLARVEPGDIVLLHDGHDRVGGHRPAIKQALPQILDGLRARGLKAVTVHQLLQPERGSRDDAAQKIAPKTAAR